MSTIVEQRTTLDRHRGSGIRGYLYGLLDPKLSILDPAIGAEVVAVSASRETDGGPRQLTEEEFRRALEHDGRILKATTDERGAFRFDTDGEGDGDGEGFDLYAVIDRIPMPTHDLREMPLPKPEYLYVGRQRPSWSERGPYLVLTIPQALWCHLKRLADAWTVTGRVTVCSDDDLAVPGVTVSAFDVDIVQHDSLGSAVTSPTGTYRIDYPGSAYRPGTWVDIELVGGPDLYFAVADSDGDVLLEESKDTGRSDGRADSRPCAHVDLCLDVSVTGPTSMPTVWTRVGAAFLLGHFDADGYAGPDKFAITGSLTMRGSGPPKTLAGKPVEYRFLVSDATAPNTSAPLPAGSFTRIVGAGANQVLFGDTIVGTMVRNPEEIEIRATLADLDADGWLDVNKSIQRAFVDDVNVDPIDIPNFAWVDDDALMVVNTGPLTTAPDVPAGLVPIGQPVPANQIPIQKKAFRFEVREVVDKPNGVFNTLPGSGRTLNAVVVSNNPVFKQLAMKEHLQTTLCSPLSGTVHVAYTAYHPHLRAASIGIVSNNHDYGVSLVDFPVPFSGNVSPALTSLDDPGVPVPANDPDGTALHRCTYLVTLSVTPRLHTGESPVSAVPVHTTFFYEP